MSNTIKDIFEKSENGTLTYEQFEALAKEKDAKFADLSDGKYVSKSKYDSDIKAVNAKEGEDVIYNLQGIRLKKPGKGIYIINGKKTIVR